MPGRMTMPKLEVGRLVAPDGRPVGFIAWDYTTVKRTTLLRPWPRRRSEVLPTLHTRLRMLSGNFAGDYDDFYEPLEGKPEVYSGTLTYKGVRFRRDELHGAEATAVINEHFEAWL